MASTVTGVRTKVASADDSQLLWTDSRSKTSQIGFGTIVVTTRQREVPAVHEPTVAKSLAEFVREQTSDGDSEPPHRVSKVKLRLGAMCGLLPHALKCAYRTAVAQTSLKGCELEIETLSLVVWCPTCHEQRLLEDVRQLRCPVCQTRTPQIIQGNELDIVSIDMEPVPAAVIHVDALPQ